MIVVAVRWYLRYGLSYRDVEELLVERGIEVDHVTVYRWVQRPPPSPCRTAWAERQRRSAVLRAPGHGPQHGHGQDAKAARNAEPFGDPTPVTSSYPGLVWMV